MTDNNIIKALECCIKLDCEKCDLKTRFRTATNCRNDLLEHFLDLINRQKAEIEKLENVEHFADKTIATQQAEIESLETHNAVLKMANELCKGWEERADVIRAEAIKEVTAELYNSFVQYETYDRLHTFEILDRINSVEECLLNNLVKEMEVTNV